MTRAEFLSSKGYWLSTIQLDLHTQLEVYMKENNLSRTQLAEKLGVTKGYVSQILNGDFDHKISKLVDLALLMGRAPQIEYTNLAKFIQLDEAKYSGVFAGNITSGNRSTERLGVAKSQENIKGEVYGFSKRFDFHSRLETDKSA